MRLPLSHSSHTGEPQSGQAEGLSAGRAIHYSDRNVRRAWPILAGQYFNAPTVCLDDLRLGQVLASPVATLYVDGHGKLSQDFARRLPFEHENAIHRTQGRHQPRAMRLADERAVRPLDRLNARVAVSPAKSSAALANKDAL